MAHARVQALAVRPIARAVVLLGVAVTALVTLAVMITAFYLTSEDGTRALNTDFRVFWAAGRLAWEGLPLDALNDQRLVDIHRITPDEWMPWLYPPAFLAVVMPIGAMPYAYAFPIWTLMSIGLIALATRPFVGGSGMAWLAISLAPAFAPALFVGQTSVLWLAVLLLALAALRDGHQVLAGVLIGLLTLKPQLGLLIPVALIAAGLWRTILAATVTTLALTVLSTLAVGWAYWPRLLEVMAMQAERVIQNIATLDLMVGSFSLLAALGVPSGLALSIQWGVLAFCAVAVFLTWRSRTVGFDAQAAMLMVAMLVSTPYLWFYETAMLAAIGLFMVRAGLLGPGLPQRAVLLLLWVGSLLLLFNGFYKGLDNQMIGACLITPLLLACLAILLNHLLLQRRTAAQPT